MYFKQSWQMYDMLPMKSVSVLPDAGMPWRDLPITREGDIFPVMVLSHTAARSQQMLTRAGLTYRVLVRCHCGQIVPFGKMSQHYASAKCTRQMAMKMNEERWKPKHRD